MLPDDLVPLADAARMSERSTRTLRRWVTAGKLQRFEGPPPDNGGSGVALVSASAVHALVITEGQSARQAELVTGGHTAGQVQGRGVSERPDIMDTRQDSAAAELAELRGRIVEAELRGQVATLRAELASQADRMADLRGQVTDARATAEDWRARHDAARAELDALRSTLHQRDGVPWWRRLLGGPVAGLPGPADG